MENERHTMPERPDVSELSLTCKTALALYSYYITIGATEKIQLQGFHIYQVHNILADDYMEEPEIIELEELLFEN